MIAERCELGLEADTVIRALRDELGSSDGEHVRAHAQGCPACGAAMRGHERVRSAWMGSVMEDPATRRAADARAMKRFAARSPAKRARAYATGIATGFAFAALLFFVHEHRKVAADAGVERSASASTSPPQPTVTAIALAPTSAPVNAPTTSMVVLRGCTGCTSAAAATELATGALLPNDASVTVPAASRLVLAFSVHDALISPEAGITVEGPAEAVLEQRGVLLRAGRGRIVAGARATLRGPHLRASGEHASWTVDVIDGRTRIEVLRGEVVVEGSEGARQAAPLRLSAGQAAVAEGDAPPTLEHRAFATPTPPPPIVIASAMPIPVPTDEPAPAPSLTAEERANIELHAAESALAAGERALAEQRYRDFFAVASADDPRRPRASFRLAELELARGAVADATPRLVALTKASDPALAKDAATLLARAARK